MELEDSSRALWADAAASVQADQDADVRFEARGLVVAEMADVTLVERIAALPIGSDIKVAIDGRGWRRGILGECGVDFLVLVDARDVLVPVQAIAAVGALPGVLHQQTQVPRIGQRGRSRGSIMRELLGRSLHVGVRDFEMSGRLTWVGADHISIDSSPARREVSSVSIPWAHIIELGLPPDWREVSGPR